jgi:YbbR domain-containing protein
MKLFEPQPSSLRAFFKSLLITTTKGAIKNWALIIFSCAIAFIAWVVVQDYENPRIQSLVPAEGEPAIIVLPVNVPDGLIVEDLPTVRVLIEAREETIKDLQAADFTAEVNAVAVAPGHSISLSVEVRTELKGVRILKVEPETVVIPVSEAGIREMEIYVRTIGELPAGYILIDEKMEPTIVIVRGLPFLVEGIDRIEATVSLSGLRDTTIFDRELVAVTATGNRVSVSIEPSRARVQLQIAERIMHRSLPITVNVTGEPRKGFAVEGITFLPPTVTISGEKISLLKLQKLEVSPVDVTDAEGSITVIRSIDLPKQLRSEIDTVVVVVTIVPLNGSRTLIVAPEFIDLPEGLQMEKKYYGVALKVEGPESFLSNLEIDDIVVRVHLQGGTIGFSSYPLEIFSPNQLKVSAPEQISVLLKLADTGTN